MTWLAVTAATMLHNLYVLLLVRVDWPGDVPSLQRHNPVGEQKFAVFLVFSVEHRNQFCI